MTSDWTLWPKAVPSKVQFADRDFVCGSTPLPSTRSPEGLSLQGKTAGGADFYASAPGPDKAAATSILIKAQTGTFNCALVTQQQILERWS
ncbi:hypothetical protein [Sinomonas sp. P47F7]|uniref:hypothetical protein n=1 Tax=Sinomonas sp. P47F7 TaxID=3410987 RepID=UPI003BF533E3